MKNQGNVTDTKFCKFYYGLAIFSLPFLEYIIVLIFNKIVNKFDQPPMLVDLSTLFNTSKNKIKKYNRQNNIPTIYTVFFSTTRPTITHFVKKNNSLIIYCLLIIIKITIIVFIFKL